MPLLCIDGVVLSPSVKVLVKHRKIKWPNLIFFFAPNITKQIVSQISQSMCHHVYLVDKVIYCVKGFFSAWYFSDILFREKIRIALQHIQWLWFESLHLNVLRFIIYIKKTNKKNLSCQNLHSFIGIYIHVVYRLPTKCNSGS